MMSRMCECNSKQTWKTSFALQFLEVRNLLWLVCTVLSAQAAPTHTHLSTRALRLHGRRQTCWAFILYLGSAVPFLLSQQTSHESQAEWNCESFDKTFTWTIVFVLLEKIQYICENVSTKSVQCSYLFPFGYQVHKCE